MSNRLIRGWEIGGCTISVYQGLHFDMVKGDGMIDLIAIPRIGLRWCGVVCLLWLGMMATASDRSNSNQATLTFEKDIRPIFRAHCYDCHGATDEFAGGLDLRLVRSIRVGGESGSALSPGNPEASLLIERVRDGEMPPGEVKLSSVELELLEQWVAAGCRTARPEPESLGPGLGITPEEREFWSFQPIRKMSADDLDAAVADSLASHPIDKLYIMDSTSGLDSASGERSANNAPDKTQNTGQRHTGQRQKSAEQDLTTWMAPEASRRTLIVRVFYDLIGLPPSPEELETWQTHPSEDWYDQLLTTLLHSPHYGERWGRHWLDAAGYADSEGYTTSDAPRGWAWKYRDWVVRSLNEDKPFDQFITEQLAGDELTGSREGDLHASQIELLTATGFLRMAADGTGSGANTPEARNQVMADTLKIVGTSLLGMSLHCAQCHDHRYDPLPQTDYFALRAVFEPSLDWQAWKTPAARQISLYTAADREKAAAVESDAQKIAEEKKVRQDQYMAEALDQELAKFEPPLRDQLRSAYETPSGQRSEDQKELLKKHPSVNITTGNLYQYIPDSRPKLAEFDKRIGEVRAKKPNEEFIRALVEPVGHAPETKLFFRGDFQQPRQTVTPAALQVACPPEQTIAFPVNDPDVPTTGRRLAFARWLTSSDNPLFARVIANRIWLHHFGAGLVGTPADFGKLGARPSHPRLLDYLAAEFQDRGWSLKGLHRFIMTSRLYRQQRGHNGFARLQRMDAEVLRDAMLVVSGQLDRTIGGPPLKVKEDDTGQVVVDGPQLRRSLYILTRRTQPVAMLQSFDAPVMETNCEVRTNSTVATQSLMLLNGEFILAQAAKLADRVADEAVELDVAVLKSLPPIPEPISSAWQYGYGGYDTEKGRTQDFRPLPHFNGTQWQGGETLPDSKLGWVLLHAGGGHPGSSGFSAIRRWTAPQHGRISIDGTLAHPSEHGDGVQSYVVSNRRGLLGSWGARHGEIKTHIDTLEVESGETIDFIVESLETVTSDSFSWPITLNVSVQGETDRVVDSKKQFRGPAETAEVIPGQIYRLWQLAYSRDPNTEEFESACKFVVRQVETFREYPNSVPSERGELRQAMTNLCQTLLSSNEFLYVE